jgi:hypothetical protein
MAQPRGRTAPVRREHVSVRPRLDRSEVVFLAGFGRQPVRFHNGRSVEVRDRVARIWPGQPALSSPWVPCARGCCLEVSPSQVPGAAAQWLRFLIETFLAPRHRVNGSADVGAPRGRPAGLVIVDDNDVFEGEEDPDDPEEGGPGVG